MIYLDSCVLIYAIEDLGERGELVRHLLRQTHEPLAVSPLVLHECLVQPIRDGDLEMRRRFTDVYERLTRIDIDSEVFLAAAEIRARHGLKAPDALHLAAAQAGGCTAVWTNDGRLAQASRGFAVNIFGGKADLG